MWIENHDVRDASEELDVLLQLAFGELLQRKKLRVAKHPYDFAKHPRATSASSRYRTTVWLRSWPRISTLVSRTILNRSAYSWDVSSAVPG